MCVLTRVAVPTPDAPPKLEDLCVLTAKDLCDHVEAPWVVAAAMQQHVVSVLANAVDGVVVGPAPRELTHRDAGLEDGDAVRIVGVDRVSDPSSQIGRGAVPWPTLLEAVNTEIVIKK
jgi:hypothetical protein